MPCDHARGLKENTRDHARGLKENTRDHARGLKEIARDHKASPMERVGYPLKNHSQKAHYSLSDCE